MTAEQIKAAAAIQIHDLYHQKFKDAHPALELWYSLFEVTEDSAAIKTELMALKAKEDYLVDRFDEIDVVEMFEGINFNSWDDTEMQAWLDDYFTFEDQTQFLVLSTSLANVYSQS